MKVASIAKEKKLLALIWQERGILTADWALPLLSRLLCKKPAGISSQPLPPPPPVQIHSWSDSGQGQQGSQAPPHRKISIPADEGGGGGGYPV